MICSIIVTYNPSELPLSLTQILIQNTNTIIVDNSTDNKIKKKLKDLIDGLDANYLDMNGNKGIAAAQNAGISLANNLNAKHLIFFDQDSKIDKIALDALCNSIISDSSTVFSITPGLFKDEATKYEIRELMSSGSGCSIKIFQNVGLYEEGLFMDCIDYEWGWRCISKGIKLIKINAGSFQHSLGRSDLRLLGFKARIDSPYRLYYQYRNIIIMFRRDYVPFTWKLKQIIKSFGKIFLILIVGNNKRSRMSYIFKGIRDGLYGISGPLKN